MHIFMNYETVHKYINIAAPKANRRHMYRRRHRHGPRGRIPKPVRLGAVPPIIGLDPVGTRRKTDPIYLEPDELEALRLVDLEGLTQEEAGKKMGVSRGTVWRLVQNARKKTAQALSEGRPIRIESPLQTDVEQNRESRVPTI